MTDPAALHEAISEEVDEILVGNDDVIEGLSIALLTQGHVLLEGVPGVAKTTIANAYARAIGLDFTRVQMTPDILPADITGTSIYREATGEFELRKGPIFTNVVVADEINRATPKTQSALLEAMQERHVTIEGDTLELPKPFMVIATQNPVEMEGVYELPQAQRDRFTLKYVVDLPDREMERTLFERFDGNPDLGPGVVEQVIDPTDIADAREHVADIHVSEAAREYILDIVEATREDPELEIGGSPRATLALLNGSKARAAINDREYVTPDDVKTLSLSVLRHRVIRNTDAELSGRSVPAIVSDLLDGIEAPGVDTSFAQTVDH